MKKVLTIAGSDTSGGAGIQADLRTFAKYNLYGMNVLTVIVSMDVKNNWSHDVFPISLECIKKQLSTVIDGIGVDALKTGMLPTVEIIDYVSKTLAPLNKTVPIVIDPVMVCKGDKPLFPEHANAILELLIKHATIVTPNLFEASQLAGGQSLETLKDAKKAAEKILKSGAKSVVIKAASSLDDRNTSNDLFFDGNDFAIIEGKYVNTEHTHGLGCTFAAHITSQLALGSSLKDACKNAKIRISKGLEQTYVINKYAGTLNFKNSFDI